MEESFKRNYFFKFVVNKFNIINYPNWKIIKVSLNFVYTKNNWVKVVLSLV